MGVVAGTPIGSPTCGLSLGVLVGMLNGSLMPGIPGGMLGSAGAGGGCGMSGVGSSGIGCSSGMSNASRNVPVPSLTPEQLIRINDPCSKSSKSRGGEGGAVYNSLLTNCPSNPMKSRSLVRGAKARAVRLERNGL